MKFQTVQAFEKHLQETPKDHFGSLFMVIASDLLERRFLSDKVVVALRKIHTNFEVVKIDLGEVSASALKEKLSSLDLFAPRKCLHMQHLEKASKTLLEELTHQLVQDQDNLIILEGQDVKNDPKFYERLKKEMIVIDLTKEKPWEKKNRIVSWMEGFVHKRKKTIQKELLETLYERCEKDLSSMVQEIDKLLCYAKESPNITMVHLEMLSPPQEEESSWALCEAIVWEKGLSKGLDKEIDPTNFYSLLGQLRYHYQIGLKIKQLMASSLTEEEVMHAFPTLQPKTFHKYYETARFLRETYFSKALTLLFTCEVKSKSQSIDLSLLWVDLLANLKKIQK